MKEWEFTIYLNKNNISKKVASDIVSRLKRIETSIKNCDIDDEYNKDKCNCLLKLFENRGNNKKIKKEIREKFPIGTIGMNTFKYAIKKYVMFKIEIENQ
ncbi:hypothetical protein NPA07_04820 [Mycoplasmopsis caviae]|uniref:Uncharacterized protein n=1 Tax=Mycoplasmopsis caviae TaxID=55603 RepID=A0A3P8MEP6_9BACT|nr:hypothetical protein [Mycoplasmopsis caviae]UUD35098.1 hypothetical protein NPA07_04820 [Mycoplasmopsis caviae]VDR42086.1 Uncharacterised protein [Mycoplasmopsis caviae]